MTKQIVRIVFALSISFCAITDEVDEYLDTTTLPLKLWPKDFRFK